MTYPIAMSSMFVTLILDTCSCLFSVHPLLVRNTYTNNTNNEKICFLFYNYKSPSVHPKYRFLGKHMFIIFLGLSNWLEAKILPKIQDMKEREKAVELVDVRNSIKLENGYNLIYLFKPFMFCYYKFSKNIVASSSAKIVQKS